MTYVKYLMVIAALAGLGLSIVAGLYKFGGHGYAVIGGFVVPLLFGGIGVAAGKGLTRPTAVLCLLGFALVAVKMREAREGDLLFILIAAGVGAVTTVLLLAIKENATAKAEKLGNL